MKQTISLRLFIVLGGVALVGGAVFAGLASSTEVRGDTVVKQVLGDRWGPGNRAGGGHALPRCLAAGDPRAFTCRGASTVNSCAPHLLVDRNRGKTSNPPRFTT